MLSSQWKDYLVTILISVMLALFVRSFIMTAYKVPTGSMQPALKAGDFIFSYRMAYSWGGKNPERGDVVVFSYVTQPNTSYVKRVVGLPGDKIQIASGKLIINDTPLDYELEANNSSVDNPSPESFDIYLERDLGHHRRVIFQKSPSEQNFGPLVVPPGEVFLLGDNRDASDDSRYWGTVPIGQIYGKVLFVWLSLDWQKRWGGERYPSIRWERVFSGVH
ncbi:signal peptidase I [Bdellovibrio sp. HCB337]|uniref:signal peptidase I n=1 Tax=Bdellovibrio sp. HCB337 TaxID=3394358 RepID=UPI0039A4ADDA